MICIKKNVGEELKFVNVTMDEINSLERRLIYTEVSKDFTCNHPSFTNYYVVFHPFNQEEASANDRNYNCNLRVSSSIDEIFCENLLEEKEKANIYLGDLLFYRTEEVRRKVIYLDMDDEDMKILQDFVIYPFRES